MVLTMGGRTNQDELVTSDSPAMKHKVLEDDPDEVNSQDVLDFSSGSSHSEGILQVFNEFRESRMFTDVVISVKGREFPCHRAVLCGCSTYFRAMFCNDHRESREMQVEINGIEVEAMDCFLSYVYTGHARITTKNVQFVFETSNLFQIYTLRDACAKFLEDQLDPCNCLGIQAFAERHCLNPLASCSRAYALKKFSEVAEHEEFLYLSAPALEEYIESDELCVKREEVVFEAVMRWVKHDMEERKSCLKKLLWHVRLPHVHPNYLIQTVENETIIQGSPECYQLLHEARRYHVIGNEMVSPRTRPRRSTGFSEVIVVVGGCERVGGFNLPYTECYDPVTGEWKSLAKLPEFTKSEYAVCALRNDILVSGGRINSRDVWLYTAQLNLWIRVASLNKGRWKHKMGVLLGKVYAVGGYDGQSCLSNVECYDSYSNRWKEVAPMKVAVSSPAVASCAGKLFVIGGGLNDNTYSDKVQCYDPESDTWSLRAKIPIAKCCITAVSLNKLIYVCGGLTRDMYCYDPAEDIWIHVTETFEKQESCGMSVCNGMLFILGGRGETGEATNNITCYDPATGIISIVPAMPRPVTYHGCVTITRYNAEGCRKKM